MKVARRGIPIERPEVEIDTASTVTVDTDPCVPVYADDDEVAWLPAIPKAITVIASCS